MPRQTEAKIVTIYLTLMTEIERILRQSLYFTNDRDYDRDGEIYNGHCISLTTEIETETERLKQSLYFTNDRDRYREM